MIKSMFERSLFVLSQVYYRIISFHSGTHWLFNLDPLTQILDMSLQPVKRPTVFFIFLRPSCIFNCTNEVMSSALSPMVLSLHPPGVSVTFISHLSTAQHVIKTVDQSSYLPPVCLAGLYISILSRLYRS